MFANCVYFYDNVLWYNSYTFERTEMVMVQIGNINNLCSITYVQSISSMNKVTRM